MMKYPEDWKIVKLGEIGTWQKGQPFAKSEISLGSHIKCIHYGELFTTYSCVIKKVISKTDSKCTISSKKGDLLFPTSDVTPEGLGRCSAILEDGILLGGDLLRFRPSVEIDSELLSYSINLNKRKIIECVTGSTVRHISSSSLSKILIILPPTLAEQKRIAEVLENADQLIDNLEKRIAKKRAIKQGSMQELLTGKKRLPGFTGEWKMVKLGEIGTWQKGQAFAKSEIFLGGHFKCIHYGELFTIYGCVIKKVISRTDSKCTISSKKGDVLFPTSDVTPEGLGRCSAILEDGILLGGDLLRFRPSVKIDSELLSYIINLNKRKIIESVTGSTVRHISSSSLSKILIILPPTLAEQRAIAKLLSDMDDEISMLERKLEKVKAVKQGMMQDLLTGKVRLRGQA